MSDRHEEWQRYSAVSFSLKSLPFIDSTNTVNEAVFIMQARKSDFLLISYKADVRNPLLGIITNREIYRMFSNDIEENIRIGRLPIEKLMIPFSENQRKFCYALRTAKLVEICNLLITPLNKPISNTPEYPITVPIVDKSRYVVGAVTPYVILNKLAYGELPVPKGLVRHHMKKHQKNEWLDVAFPDYTFNDLAAHIRRTGRRTIPVVEDDKDWTVQGLITDQNVSHMARNATSNVEIQQTHANDSSIMIGINNLDLIRPDWELSRVLPLFTREPFPNALIVVESIKNRKLAGILSYVDVIAALLKN